MNNQVNPNDLRIEDLDKLSITDKKGLIVAKITLIITLYSTNTHTFEKKSGLINCIESYLKLTGNNLKLHFFERGHVKKFASDKPPDFTAKKEKFTEDTPFGYSATGSESDISEASAYSFSSLFNADYDNSDAGFISASFPVHFVLTQAPGFLRELCLNWAEQIQAQHGYAGFGLQRSVIVGHAQNCDVQAYPLIQRFPGLELDDPLTHSVHCRDKIKGINWLTVLSDKLAAALGGEDEIQRNLKGDANIIHHWKGGIALQAGPHPQLGDIEKNNTPAAYRQVYRAIKEIQVDYPWPLMSTPLDVDAQTFSRTWFKRFE